MVTSRPWEAAGARCCWRSSAHGWTRAGFSSLGLLPHEALLDLFRLSAAHVHLTAPDVLSWSQLDIMACGALVVAPRTSPVLEVLDGGQDGLLVPFTDPDALATTLLKLLRRPAVSAPLRLAARQRIVAGFDRRVGMTRQRALLAAAAPREDPLAAAGCRHD